MTEKMPEIKINLRLKKFYKHRPIPPFSGIVEVVDIVDRSGQRCINVSLGFSLVQFNNQLNIDPSGFTLTI